MTVENPSAGGISASQADRLAANAMLIAVRQSAGIICDRWSISVILAVMLGASRFNALAETSGVTGGMLAGRLRRLEDDGLLLRVPYSRRPLRYEYRLTNMGAELFDVIVEMVRWERRWFPGMGSAAHDFVAATTPKALETDAVCVSCGRPIDARAVDVRVSRALMQKIPAQQSAYRRSSVSSATRSDGKPLLGVSLDLLGDTWSIEIINCAFLRLHRFGDYRAQTGIAANILSDRLGRLVAYGFMQRRGSEEDTDGRGYWLTEVGIGFYPTLLRMQDWADKWISGRTRSPVTLIHRPCGASLRLRPRSQLEATNFANVVTMPN